MRSVNTRRLLLLCVIAAVLMVIPVLATAAGLSEKDVGSIASVTASELKVREKASTSSKVLFTLKKNANVTLTAYNNGWFQIKTENSKTGYASANYLKLVTPAQVEITPEEAGEDSGNKAGRALSIGDSGNEVKELQEKLRDLGYYTYDKITGYYGEVTAEAVSAFQRDAGLTVTGNVDSITSQRIFSGIISEPDSIEEAATSTAKPSATPSGTSTVASSAAQPTVTPTPAETTAPTTPTPTPAPTATPTDTSAEAQDGPPVDESRALIQEGTTNTSDLGYEDNDDESTFTGTPPPAAPNVEGQAPVPVITKVEKLYWFSGNGETANEVYKRGMTAIITDVRTGITFSVKRLGGTNHADNEPLTKFDTSQMYKAYGNSWKWDRRPVFVTVGERTMAGSMNGMPHGGSSITTNNFNGHFCIHFVKSKTHGTGKVDAQHQAAIEEAYKAGQKLYPTATVSAVTETAEQPAEAATAQSSDIVMLEVTLPEEEDIILSDNDPYAAPVEEQ